MIQMIAEAIQTRLTLCFSYKGEQRKAEPHTYGVSSKGEDMVCAWQTVGSSGQGYRLFMIDGMSGISLGDGFSNPRPGYHRNDQRFVSIFAEL